MQVGKRGVTSELIKEIEQKVLANYKIKLKVLKNIREDNSMGDVEKNLSESLPSNIVVEKDKGFVLNIKKQNVE